MVLFLDEHFVLGKTGDELSSVFDDPVENIYSDREIGSKNERAIAIQYGALDLVTLAIPPRGTFDQRNPGDKACIDIATYRCSRREIDRGIGSTQLRSELSRGESRVSVIYDRHDL